LVVAGGADAAGGGRIGAHAGRQQQRLLAGQRNFVAELGGGGRGSAGFYTAADRAAPGASRVPAAAVVRRVQHGGRRSAGHRVVYARWKGNGAGALGERVCEVA